MIPLLYPKTATKADAENSNGLGHLSDCIKCEITEERNGTYEAVMQYPISGELYPFIEDGAIIKAAANETSSPQLFRIYKSSKPAKGVVTYNAEHISYALNALPIKGLQRTNISAQTAINAALLACPVLHDFHGYSDILTHNSIDLPLPCFIRAALGGKAGSILDIYGGEFEFDNYDVHLWQHRGTESDTVLRYGKNITDIKQESIISNCYTHIMPYATQTTSSTDAETGEITTTQTVVTLSESVLQLVNPAAVGHTRVLLYDFSKEFEADQEITEEALRTLAQAYIQTADLASPQVNITLSFAALWAAGEYADIETLERLRLCDTVRVLFEPLGITATAKVVKTVFNSLTERYTKIEVGSVKANFSNTVKSITQSINTSVAEAAANNAVLTSKLLVEAERITAEVTRASDAEGLLSGRIDTTAEAISAEVTRATEAEGALSGSIQVTAEAVTTEVSRATEAEGALDSRITTTAESITSEVTRATEAEGELRSTIEQTATSIAMVVDADGINAAAIMAAINDDTSTVSISADKINLNGVVTANGTFKIKTDGTFEATGGKIGEFTVTPGGLTSTLGYNDNWVKFDIISKQEQKNSDERPDCYIKLLEHQDEVNSNEYTQINTGSIYFEDYWAGLEKYTGNISSGGASWKYAEEDYQNGSYVWIDGKSVTISSYYGRVSAYEFKNLSDERVKKDIADIAPQAAVIFDNLHPRQYRYKPGKDNDLHFGFIAQEVAAVCGDQQLALISPPEKEGEMYSLNYIEIIALCVKEIQTLKAKVAELEKGKE